MLGTIIAVYHALHGSTIYNLYLKIDIPYSLEDNLIKCPLTGSVLVCFPELNWSNCFAWALIFANILLILINTWLTWCSASPLISRLLPLSSKTWAPYDQRLWPAKDECSQNWTQKKPSVHTLYIYLFLEWTFPLTKYASPYWAHKGPRRLGLQRKAIMEKMNES